MNLFLATAYTNQFRALAGAGSSGKINEVEKKIIADVPHTLESYHYVNRQRFVDTMRALGAQIFLDSGAFSAHTLGVEINIDEYCDYILRNRDIIRVEEGVTMASVLDGIGDPYKTWQNQMHMEQRGAKPLPCFHYGEDVRYLEWYLERYPYITLGGMVRRTTEDLCDWLDHLWDKYLTDGSGRPRLKVHAFGITSTAIMRRYPWYSVDSSSWIQYAVYGHVYHPTLGMITVSEKSPSRKQEGRHVTTLSVLEQAAVLNEFRAAGFSYERLSQVYESRAVFNAWSYCKLESISRYEKGTAFELKQQGLF